MFLIEFFGALRALGRSNANLNVNIFVPFKVGRPFACKLTAAMGVFKRSSDAVACLVRGPKTSRRFATVIAIRIIAFVWFFTRVHPQMVLKVQISGKRMSTQ